MSYLSQMLAPDLSPIPLGGDRHRSGDRGDPGRGPAQRQDASATSASTSSAAPSTSSSRSPWSPRIILVASGAIQNLNGLHLGHHARGRRSDHRPGPDRRPGGDQGAGHQRRRLLQRQLRPPVREPDRAHQRPGDLPVPADPASVWRSPSASGSATQARASRSSRRWRSSWSAAAPSRPGRSRPATRPSRPAATSRRTQGGNMEGKEVRFGSPQPPLCHGHHRHAAPDRSTPPTTASRPSAGFPMVHIELGEITPGASAPASTGCSPSPSSPSSSPV